MSIIVLQGESPEIVSFHIKELGFSSYRKVKKLQDITFGFSLFEDNPVYVVDISVKKEWEELFDIVGDADNVDVVVLAKRKPTAGVMKILQEKGALIQEVKRIDVRDYVKGMSSKLYSEVMDYAGDDNSILIAFINNFRNVSHMGRVTIDDVLTRLSSQEGAVAPWTVSSNIGSSEQKIISSYRRYVSGNRKVSSGLVFFLLKELRLISIAYAMRMSPQKEIMKATGIASDFRLRKIQEKARLVDIDKLRSPIRELGRLSKARASGIYYSDRDMGTIMEKTLVDITLAFR